MELKRTQKDRGFGYKKAIDYPKTEKFEINVSPLKNYDKEQIKFILKKYSKKELLEALLGWQMLSKHFEASYDELLIKNNSL